MNKTVVCGIGFVTGVAIGAVASWIFAKTKYQKIADEEIASVKEYFTCPKVLVGNELPTADGHKKVDSFVNSEAGKAEQARLKKDLCEYAAAVKNTGYTNYARTIAPEVSAAVAQPDSDIDSRDTKEYPYIISPDEFDEVDEYVTEVIMYYADGVTVGDDDEPLDDPNTILGTEWPNRFGEYENDAVYVRNDVLKCDYEILRDLREYRMLGRADLNGREPKPHELLGDEEED